MICGRWRPKALSAQSDPDGGYLVPTETERLIDRIVSDASPIRVIAGVRQIGRGELQEALHGFRSGQRLGGRDGSADGDCRLGAFRNRVPGDGALRHAGGDLDTA